MLKTILGFFKLSSSNIIQREITRMVKTKAALEKAMQLNDEQKAKHQDNIKNSQTAMTELSRLNDLAGQLIKKVDIV